MRGGREWQRGHSGAYVTHGGWPSVHRTLGQHHCWSTELKQKTRTLAISLRRLPGPQSCSLVYCPVWFYRGKKSRCAFCWKNYLYPICWSVPFPLCYWFKTALPDCMCGAWSLSVTWPWEGKGPIRLASLALVSWCRYSFSQPIIGFKPPCNLLNLQLCIMSQTHSNNPMDYFVFQYFLQAV